jgi:transposase
MREMSVAEQRYLAVLAVIAEGHEVSSVAQQWGVSRQTLHAWLGRYEEPVCRVRSIGRTGRCRVRIRCRQLHVVGSGRTR